MAFPISYLYRCPLTVDHTKLSADVSNFPVLLTAANLPGQLCGTTSQSALEGGGDIRFSSDSAGLTQLACDIVSFVRNAKPSNATVEIWVKVPTVSFSSNTVFYVWWGGPDTSQPLVSNNSIGRNGVWTNSFQSVHHLTNISTGLVNSQGYTDIDGSGTSVANATGKINGGVSFSNASNSEVNCGTVGTDWNFVSNQLTLECWVNPTEDYSGTVGRRSFIKVNDSGGTPNLFQFFVDTGNPNPHKVSLEIRTSTGGIDNPGGNTTLPQNTWSHIAVTLNSGTYNFYYNGSSDGQTITSNNPGSLADNSAGRFIGFWPGQPTWSFDGIMDEVRVQGTARTAGWILASYNTQNSPSTFLTAGSVYTRNNAVFFGNAF